MYWSLIFLNLIVFLNFIYNSITLGYSIAQSVIIGITYIALYLIMKNKFISEKSIKRLHIIILIGLFVVIIKVNSYAYVFLYIFLCETIIKFKKDIILYTLMPVLLNISFLIKNIDTAYMLLIAQIFIYSYYENKSVVNKAWVTNDELRVHNERLLSSNRRKDTLNRQIYYTSKLEERNKIAQNLHDKLGHTISGSLMQLEAINILIDKDKDKAKEMLKVITGVLREGMDDIRGTLRDLKPNKEEVGFNRAKLMLEEFSYKSQIKTTLSYTGDLQVIDYDIWNVVIENLREILTNTMKYSKATNLGCRIVILNKLIKIEIKDNGIGTKAFKKGVGIMGIEERVATLNGKVIFHGSDGFSTVMLFERK
ncbi:sensor histidine kinase [Clostridium hydrogeniformans]|uniref:sensor histidine kinase n=1 Tax=Clostridium hydrogeniformans TaxID=349933 RepID=UPI00068D6176|nr:sensor histidine kinase [Clostridium hydrogeniformans]